MKNPNNWNGEFLRYKVREIAIVILFVIGLAGVCMLCSCSGAGTIRTKGGTSMAGTFSFLGKQSIQKAAIRTVEGDSIELDGYSTRNPDPALVEGVKTGVVTLKTVDKAAEILQPTAQGVGKAIGTLGSP